MMGWLRTNQEQYYEGEFHALSETLLSTGQKLTGSLNSMARSLNVEPATPAPYQAYNLAEMFRVSVLAKMGAYLQAEVLTAVIAEQADPTIMSVLTGFKEQYPQYKQPTYETVKRTLARLTSTGVLHNLPKADGVLSFWVTDTHYSKLTRTGRYLHFTLKLENLGPVTLKFTLPKKERFQGGKATRPTVYVGRKGELRYGFTIQHKAPTTTSHSTTLGVDLGQVVPFTGTVLSPDGAYTPAFIPHRRINKISAKITRLNALKDQLWVKEQLNDLRGHEAKMVVLRTERLRVRSKVSRLKVERAHHMANQIVSIAQQYGAQILLENLSWTPHSTWEHSTQQEAITHKAKKHGVRVKKISPKNTSQTCPHCGGRVEHSGRVSTCLMCSRVLDRDVLASRNIARGMVKSVLFKCFTQSLHTRVTNPVTTGVSIDYVQIALTSNTT